MKEAHFYMSDEGRRARNIPLAIINKTPLEIWIEVANFIYSFHPTMPIEVMLANLNPNMDLVIIDDMRRVAEHDFITQRNGWTVRVDRDGREPISNIDVELTGVGQGWSFILSNNAGLGELEQAVRVICDDVAKSFAEPV